MDESFHQYLNMEMGIIIIHAQQIPVMVSFSLVVIEESIDDQPSCLVYNS